MAAFLVLKRLCRSSTGYRGVPSNNEVPRGVTKKFIIPNQENKNKQSLMKTSTFKKSFKENFEENSHFNRIESNFFPQRKGFINIFIFGGKADTVYEETMLDKVFEWESFFKNKVYRDSIHWNRLTNPSRPFGIITNKQFNNVEYFDNYEDIDKYILSDTEKYF
tara:strand:- start:551 stop:1042 length:492 start_codon:yes stop_codon:yes gene_type:complete